MELLIVRFPFLCNPPHHTGSGCCSAPAGLQMFSEDRNSTGAFLFFAFICRFVLVGRTGFLFTAITGVALNLSSTSAFDLACCLLQSCLPHHPEPFTRLRLLSVNKKPRTNSGSPRDAVPMTYCTNIFQGQAWTVRLLSARREGKEQVRCRHRRDEMDLRGPACLLAHCCLLVLLKTLRLPWNRLACFPLAKNTEFWS